MTGGLGLWRAVVRRSRADLPVVTATWLLLLSAITLLAGGVVYGDTAALAALQRGVLAAPGPDRSIVVGESASGEQLANTDTIVRDQVDAALRPATAEIDLVLRADGLAPRGTSPDVVDRMTELASFEGLEGHATLIAGRWATALGTPIEATVSEGAAAALGLSVGDRVALAGRVGSTLAVDLEIVGIWRSQADDPYWLGSTLDLTGIEQEGPYVTRGPFAIEQADLVRLAGGRQVNAQWHALPAVDTVTSDGVEAMQTGLASLTSTLDASLPGQSVQVKTSLPAILASVSQSVLVGRSGILLLTIQFGILAGYAVVLVAGILVERRRPEVALLRARGATAGHLAGLAFGEALLLTVPAAVLAPFLASAVIRVLDLAGPLASSGLVRAAAPGPDSFVVAALAGIACLVALTVPALGSGSSPVQVRVASGRQVGGTLGKRLGIDVALLLLAAIAIWQLRLYGGPLTRNIRGTLGLDPLLVAAPGIGLLAGAVAGTRFFPRLAEAAERWLTRRRGLVPSLGARHLSRRPLRSTRSALLLMLAAALGTFAAAYGATWRQSQEDQAAYQTAAEIRLTSAYHADLPTLALGGAYRAVPGVTAAEPVAQRSLEVGRSFSDGQLLAVDASAVGDLVRPQPDGSTGNPGTIVGQLATARPVSAALLLPGSPGSLALTIDANLRGADASGAGVDPGSIDVAVVIEGTDGLERIDAGSAAPVGAGQRLVVPLAATAGGTTFRPTGALRLEAIELTLAPPDGATATGTMAVRAIDESADASAAGGADASSAGGAVIGGTGVAGASWTNVAFDAGAAGWAWTVQTGTSFAPYATGTPDRVSIGESPGDAFPVTGDSRGPVTTFRLWAQAVPASALPAVVSAGLLRETGAGMAETIAATSLGDPIALQAVAATDAFPPLDPGRPFAIVDRLTYQLDRFARSGSVDAPEEWWLGASPEASRSVAAALRLRPYSAQSVLDRAQLLADRTTDPIPLGLIGALALGSIAALAIAGIGFVVSATESATERIAEFAILRALGLSARALALWLALESAVLLGFGLLAGSGLGLLLAWLVMPFATLTPTGIPPVPAPILVIPPWSFVPLFGLAIALLILSAVAAGRQVPAVGLGGLLRAEDA